MTLLSKIQKRYNWIYSRYRDYYFLRDNLHQKNKSTLFIGSSYTLFGVIPSADNVILALQSQDIYYSYKILQKYLTINEHKPLNVYLGLGYYALYHDLSLTKSDDENNRIHDIYYPLFKDLHNMPFDWYKKTCARFCFVDKCIKFFVCEKFNFIKTERERDYFNKKITRISKSRKTWKDISKEWKNLTFNEKENAANKRVAGHEKILKYNNTREENKEIMKKIKELCEKKGCNLYIFIAPMSEQYLKSMSNMYKEKSNELISFLKELNVNVMDFNISCCFKEDDFVDADHLDEQGAIKLSLIINSQQLEDFYLVKN